jgi:hypothetical protein
VDQETRDVKFLKSVQIGRLLSAAAVVMVLGISSTFATSQATDAALSDSAAVTANAAAAQWIVPSLTLTPVDYRTAAASWPIVAGYSSYTLQWSTSSSFTSPSSITVSGNSYDVSGLAALTNYYFRVQAVGAPTAGWSSIVTMKTTAVTVLKSMFAQLSRWPSASSIDTKGNVWITGYIGYTAKIISPDGTVKNVGAYDNATPVGITLVNDNLALLPRYYKDAAQIADGGIYSISSAGIYTKVSNLLSVYGLAYDSKRSKVYVTRGSSLQECDYSTWACTTIASQTNSSFGYVALTPSKDKLIVAGKDESTLGIYNLVTRTYTVIDSTPSLDVRSVEVIGETDFIAGSALTGDVWRIKTNAAGTALASKQTIATGIDYPLNLSVDPALKILYMGGSASDSFGVYRYENMIP